MWSISFYISQVILSFLLSNKNPVCVSLSYVPHVLSISSFLILSLQLHLAKSTNYGAPYSSAFLQLLVTSFPLCPNTLFSTIFTNTFYQYSSINMKYKVSHSYTFKITDKIMVMCFLILVFLDRKWEDRSSRLKSSRHSPHAANWFFSCMHFWFLVIK
jgi:hypothetical protein